MSTSYEKDEIESVMDSLIDNKVGSRPTEFDVSLATDAARASSAGNSTRTKQYRRNSEVGLLTTKTRMLQ